MTDGLLSSQSSVEIRSIGLFALLLGPVGVLLIFLSWSGNQLGDALVAAQLARREAPALSWSAIAHCPFDGRTVFIAGMRRQLAQFELRHPAPAGDPRTEAMRDAQSRMAAELNSLRLATPDTWENAKQEVGDAWRRLQATSGANPSP